ncbi:hypothetical protein BLNAU_24124 [Blattamonas nauphoetae]|uniref:Uncharacterized protein n=1 Tax=Blattamonas nauphoetae TaxID=2049346 RepID=A0ABQ9WNA5_9EUKA|nr:hypothetical protein BLNAU_24124 [Blattamonas nauphoetae]
MSEGFWDHGKCGQERLPCSSLDFAFSLLTQTKTEISLGSNITLSTLLECPETGASISSSSEASLLFVSDGQIILEVGSLTLSSIDITLPSSLSQSLLVVKGSTLTLSSTVTITTPPSAAHTASLFKIEGGRLALSGTVFFFASRRRHLFSLKREGTLDEIKMEGASTMYVSTGCEFKTISQTESGGGAFLSTNGNNNQILSIASSSFESVSSVGDGGVILAPFPLTPTAALVDMHRRWNTVNTSDDVPLVLFLADVGSTGFASSSGSDGELCGFSVNPCSSIDLVQTRLAANGSKTEGKLKPITIELQKRTCAIDAVFVWWTQSDDHWKHNHTLEDGSVHNILSRLCADSLLANHPLRLFADPTSHFSLNGIGCGVWLHNQEWRCRHSCRVWIGFGRAVGTEWDEHDEIGVHFLLALRCDIWDSEDWIKNVTDSLNHTTDIISVRSKWRINSLLDSLKWIVQISSTQIKARQI